MPRRRLTVLSRVLVGAIAAVVAAPAPATNELTANTYYAYVYQLQEPIAAKKFPIVNASYRVDTPDYQALRGALMVTVGAKRGGVGVNGVKWTATGTVEQLGANDVVIDVRQFQVKGRTDRGGFDEGEALADQILKGMRYRVNAQLRARGKKPVDEMILKGGISFNRGCTPALDHACLDGRFQVGVAINGQDAEVFPPETDNKKATFFVPGRDVIVGIQNACEKLGIYVFQSQTRGGTFPYVVVVRDILGGHAVQIKDDGVGSGFLKCAAQG